MAEQRCPLVTIWAGPFPQLVDQLIELVREGHSPRLEFLGDELFKDRGQRLFGAHFLVARGLVNQPYNPNASKPPIEDVHPFGNAGIPIWQRARVVCIKHCVDYVFDDFRARAGRSVRRRRARAPSFLWGSPGAGRGAGPTPKTSHGSRRSTESPEVRRVRRTSREGSPRSGSRARRRRRSSYTARR